MIETINNKGTTYTIGGDNYSGQWILPLKSDYIVAGETFGGNVSRTYDISSWLPDDGYDYDVQFSGYIRTGSTSGNGASVDIITDTGTLIIDRENTRSSSNHIGAGGGILRIPADNKVITVKNYATAATGNCGLDINMIRRVGKQAELTSGYIDKVQYSTTTTTTIRYYAWTNVENSPETVYTRTASTTLETDVYYKEDDEFEVLNKIGNYYINISSIINSTLKINVNASESTTYNYTRDTSKDETIIDTSTSTQTTPFGGSNFDGSFTWLANESQVEIGGSNFTMAANSYNTFSLPFLPNDGYDYELIVSGSFNTGSKSGNVVSANIFGGTVNSTNAPNSGFRLCRQVTRTNSSENCAGSGIVVIPANDRNITVWNLDGNAKSGVCSLNANAYRRIGKNV